MAVARDELPEGWEWYPLSEIAPINTEPILPKNYPDQLFNYIALENIESGTGKLINFAPALGAAIGSNKSRFSTAHVLYGKLRPYLNKVLVPEFDGVCATDILPLRPNPKRLTREYLALWLRSPDFVEYARAKMEGAKMPRLRTPDIEGAMIAVPPLPEQRRIVARIEEFARRVEEARGLRREAVEWVEAVLPAARQNIFNAENLEAPVSCLEELTIRITKGESPAWQGFTYQESGALFVRSENVLWGKLDLSHPIYIPVEFHRKLSRSQLRAGDVLINLVGASIGRSCVVPADIGDANVNQAVAVISSNPKQLDSEYLMHFLISAPAQKAIHGEKVETARPNISLGNLRNLTLPVPPLDEQRRIVAYLDGLQAKAEAIRAAQVETQKELDALMPSVLAKAFGGEL